MHAIQGGNNLLNGCVNDGLIVGYLGLGSINAGEGLG